jgi:hypothetical protein
MLAVGRVATVAGAGAALGGVAEPAAGGGDPEPEPELDPSRLGMRFAVALAQFALYPSRDLAAVGLTAKTIPD